VYLTGDAAGLPGLASAVESLLSVTPRSVADPAAAVALGAAGADEDVFATIGSLSRATRSAAMARNKAAGSLVMAAGATAARDFGADEPEGDIWWRDQGLTITLILLGIAFFTALAYNVMGG
jgi:hypothetical protein